MINSSIAARIDRWVASQPIRRQYAIAVVSLFTIALTVGTVLASVMLAWLTYAAGASYPVWWAVVFGVVMAVLAVVKERERLLPEGGFTVEKPSNDRIEGDNE